MPKYVTEYLTEDVNINIHAEDWETAEEIAKALNLELLGELITVIEFE
jgi:hypothetical protein